MILYLSRNETIDLIDPVANELSIHIRKMSGSYCLQEFVVRDMRKYVTCEYFCVDRFATTESDNEFIEALKSFQMMYSAEIIVIYESTDDNDLLQNLISNGITKVITAIDVSEQQSQLIAYMSDDIFCDNEIRTDHILNTNEIKKADNVTKDNYTLQADNILTMGSIKTDNKQVIKPIFNNSIKRVEKESYKKESYRFDCVNISIAIAGATRRAGTTITAIGLASWINAHGGSVCYVQLNPSKHLQYISGTYKFEVCENCYSYDGIDYYINDPDINYNFIIYDYGVITKATISQYKECDIKLFCGNSNYPHEIIDFIESLKQVKSADPIIITLKPNEKYEELFYTEVTDSPVIVNLSKEMFDYTINQSVYKPIVERYIVETNKRF